MQRRVYLDHASATPWHPAALAAAAQASEHLPGDPSRAHGEGRAARDLLESARAAVAATLGAATERVAFTSGGTEAVHLAVRGTAAANRTRPKRILSSAVEHSAVHAAAEATDHEHVRVAVDREGRMDLDALDDALRGGAALVNLQHANHEVGTLQPVAEAAARCRQAGALLHVDACQTAGRLPVDLHALGADLVSLSGAKFGGGRGIGALAWSPQARFRALLTGDEREARRRSGLEHLPGAAALAETLLQSAPNDPAGNAAAERTRCDRLRRRLRALLAAGVEDLEVHGPATGAAPHIVAVSALYVEGQALLAELDRAGFAVHSGSSCATTSGEPSHVLVAMGALTHGHIRASVGHGVGESDVEAFAQAVADAVGRLRARVAIR
ncbi:MAG: aminotransferase class V-fold PLP-dependent enzyme [Nitriliruptorales bacterium]|nr:aminotransferase class V-fold PLP-dependent enzyme [Nitriliruptorales bacterium]